jgi:hypothetical protein
MSIELRFSNTGEGNIVVACVHCGQDVGDPREGLVVWRLEEEPDPAAGTVFHADYAHSSCEEQFQEGLPGPEYREVAKKLNLPFIELLDALREPGAPEGEDLEAREA